MNDFSSLGANLKAIREKRQLNLNEAAERTGISKAMLSKIERGESTPTITTVWKIANGLQISLNELAKSEEEQYEVKNIAEMTPLIDDEGLFSLYNMFPFSPLDGVQIMYGIMKPGYRHEDGGFIHESNAKEYCIVFEGQVEVEIDGIKMSLNEGCGIEFDPKKPHGYTNIGETDARVCFMLK